MLYIVKLYEYVEMPFRLSAWIRTASQRFVSGYPEHPVHP